MQKLNKFTSVFTALCIILSCAAFSFTSAAQETIIITTAEQLAEAAQMPGKNYALGADIVFTEEDFQENGRFYNGGKKFPVIGTEKMPFTGVFDGQGYRIQGLEINRPSEKYVGLFGYNQGTIKNIALIACDITGGAYTGGIAAYVNSGAVVTQCYSSGSTIKTVYTGKNARLGGIAGINVSGGTVSNCYNNSDVIAEAPTPYYAAGLVGENSGSLTRCYNAAILDESVDYAIYANGKSIQSFVRTINAADLGANTDFIYAAVQSWSSSEEMSRQETYRGFDFENIWTMEGNPEYPYPELRGNIHKDQAAGSPAFRGTGVPYDPYVITEGSQISLISAEPNACYRLAGNIIAGESFDTIPLFNGILYGEGFKISGLKTALIGNNSGRIENLAVAGEAYLTDVQGMLAGINSNMIIHCSVSGSVRGENSADIAGLCGQNNARIYQAENFASVSGGTRAGGVSALNYGGIYDSVNYGDIVSVMAGGIAAESAAKSTGLFRCVNHGDIQGVTHAAGVAAVASCNVQTAGNTGSIRAKGADALAGGVIADKQIGTVGTVLLNTGYVEAVGSNAVAGGISGANMDQLYHALNSGRIFGTYRAGGITGMNKGMSNGYGSIRFCINYGYAASEKDGLAAAISGNNSSYLSNAGEIQDSYYIETDLPAYNGSDQKVGSIYKVTAEQLKAAPGMDGFDTTSMWAFDGQDRFPYLQYFGYQAVEGISLALNEVVLYTGDKKTMQENISPQDATVKAVVWSTDNPSVAQVDGFGRVTAISPGSAVITVTATDGGASASCVVNVFGGNVVVFREGGETAYHVGYGATPVDAEFLIRNNRSFVPVRAAAAASGCDGVEALWRDGEYKVQVKANGLIYEFQIDGGLVLVWDENRQELLAAKIIDSTGEYPFLSGGRAYLPARIMTQITGVNIEFAERSAGNFVIFSEIELTEAQKKYCLDTAEQIL